MSGSYEFELALRGVPGMPVGRALVPELMSCFLTAYQRQLLHPSIPSVLSILLHLIQ